MGMRFATVDDLTDHLVRTAYAAGGVKAVVELTRLVRRLDSAPDGLDLDGMMYVIERTNARRLHAELWIDELAMGA